MTPRTFTFKNGATVDRIGFGAMRLTGRPGNFGRYPDWASGLDLLREARDLGVDLFDSAWAYGPETADQIVGEALEGRGAFLATKGGVDKPEAGRIVVDGRPARLLEQIERALENLRTDRIDLFQLHRIDPEVPIETSVAALAQAQADGKIGLIGLSNVTRHDLERAQTVAPIAAVQNRFNMAQADDAALVDYTARHGIAFLPYGPLGAHPMQPGAKLEPRAALAWLLRRSPNIIVIPGTTSAVHLRENWDTWAHVERLDRKAA